MSLKFRDCRECGESHALRPDGRMSIHTTNSGARCTEPTAQAAAESGKALRPSRTVSLTPRADEDDPELQAAFDASNARRRKVDDREPGRPDRRIYATTGVRTVRGGVPGGGKRR
ncbi:hypothetical protein [Microbacterium hydrocarbonoxydans]|uniref:hypothetical protein n=1 Tax=Microbacterium hydrocarbonoxydans TaxID=273678 RepID=UPI001269DDED|nr:hypothetical protein [Microbacterium hydrocarbonoxydans]